MGAERKVLSEKVSGYKTNQASMKTDFESAKNNQERSQLLGSGNIGEKSMEQRQKMLDTQEKFALQNEKIFNATRIVAETEEVGNEIIGELEKNREKIESTQDKVKQVNSDMDVAKTTVKRMNDREKRCTISQLLTLIR